MPSSATPAVVVVDTDDVDDAAVFSAGFLKRYCRKAQRKLAKASLNSVNTVFDDIGNFTLSSPAPYDGDAMTTSLPLGTSQFVGFGNDANGEEYAQTVMCKTKSAEAINFYYPDAHAKEGRGCNVLSKWIVRRVTRALEYSAGITVPPIVYEDFTTYTGPQWVDSSPAPSAYISSVDGKLHIIGKGIFVERLNPSPFIGADKKGVQSCQSIAPAYLLKILQGDVTPPTCDAPPVYSPPTAGPPQGALPWNCVNP